jgi:phospholipase C
MYVVSPWSKGGWVNSEVFDHTSVGRFIETRFDVTIPAISPWHRAVCGDLTSCFDFAGNDRAFPDLPDVTGSAAIIAEHQQRPRLLPPRAPQELHQETGIRRSRALPYRLAVDARAEAKTGTVDLRLRNDGTAGAVFHVYDRHHLDRIPRRYTVEAGKELSDTWSIGSGQQGERDGFDLWVLGPNGFLRHFRGTGAAAMAATVEIRQHGQRQALEIAFANSQDAPVAVSLGGDAYGHAKAEKIAVPPKNDARTLWSTARSHDWYDFVVSQEGMEIRAAGRIERDRPGISDPLMAVTA